MNQFWAHKTLASPAMKLRLVRKKKALRIPRFLLFLRIVNPKVPEWEILASPPWDLAQAKARDRTRSSTPDSSDRDPRSNPDEFGTSAGLVRRCFAAW